LYLITIDADVSGGKKGINVDTGAGEQRDVGGEERDVGAGEQRDVGGGEEEKVGNPNNEDDNDEWFTDFSYMRKEVEVEVETDGYHLEEFKNQLVVMMKMGMLTKFILNIMKVFELVNRCWN